MRTHSFSVDVHSWLNFDSRFSSSFLRARDNALRAVALSCRNNFAIWHPELIQDVSINFTNLLSFYLSLKRNRNDPKSIRSIEFTEGCSNCINCNHCGHSKHLTQEDTMEMMKERFWLERFADSHKLDLKQDSYIRKIVELTYASLPNIENLIIQQPELTMPLQYRMPNNKLAPLPFFAHSLKKLYLRPLDEDVYKLRARQLVWLLVFCKSLREVCLAILFDSNDFKFLCDHSDGFAGLSNIKELSLGAEFDTSTDSAIKKWSAEAGSSKWIGRNKTTHSIYQLLRVTKQLCCFELNYITYSDNQEMQVNSNCLSALQESSQSLMHLRIISLGLSKFSNDPNVTSLSLFQNLKVLSLDYLILSTLAGASRIKLPVGLEGLCIPYSNLYSAEEDSDLVKILKNRSLPTLKTVILPLKPASRDMDKPGAPDFSDDFKKAWMEGRKALKKAEIFESGKVKLRFVKPGDLSK